MMPGMSLSRISARTGGAAFMLLLVIAGVSSAGCKGGGSSNLVDPQTNSRFGRTGVDNATQTAYPVAADFIRLLESGEELYVFNGRSGEPLTGRQVLNALRAADVVILGETHTDPMAHRLQDRFVREALATGGGALSLEMISREEQPILNKLAGRPAAAESGLNNTRFASGWRNWRMFYLPAIQAALELDRPVIAANAPREIVSDARLYGYDYLRGLPADRQRLFELPEADDDFPEYRRRVMQMLAAHAPAATQPGVPTTRPSTRPQRERQDAHGELDLQPTTRRGAQTRPTTGPANRATTQRATTRRIYTARAATDAQAFYEAQLVWDATMAQSILEARRRYGRPIVHLVGSFHSDFDGGLTQMLEQGNQEVLTISFVPDDSQRLRPEDEKRADIVIYTGANRPMPQERVAPATRATTRPTTRATPATQPGRAATTRPVGGS